MALFKNLKINKYFLLVLVIFVFGIILRLYQFKERFIYDYDHDLASWIIRDIIVNHHLRLVGQETSTHGVYIGGLYYYFMAPFYLLTKMDPIALAYGSMVLGIIGLISVYFVFSRIFSKKIGVIALTIFATSAYMINNDQEAVPTVVVITWSIWFFYALNLILKGEQKKALLILAILVGLIWHVNFALILLTPLILVALFLARKKLGIRDLVTPFVTFLVISIPLMAFELRHNFLEVRSIFASITTKQSDVVYSGLSKFSRVIYLLNKDFANAIWGSLPVVGYSLVTMLIFLGIFVFLVYKRQISRNLAILMAGWILLYVAFFSSYSKIVSEYYLNGSLIIVLSVLIFFISYLLDLKKMKWMGFLILVAFALFNIYRNATVVLSRNGYLEREATVLDIKQDALNNGYPCISVSYITNPGYQLGYRYFLWFEGVKTKPISLGAPVYSIVFPQEVYFKTNKDFGAIGVIYPDYLKYKKSDLNKICSGDDYNVTEPIFGYTD